MSATEQHDPPKTRIRRVPRNAHYDRASVERVLDRGQLAHIAFASDGHPYCIPMLYARIDDRILIHGSRASRLTRLLASGAPACVTVTVLDGWVLARSAFQHSANYDSVVLFGQFRPVEDDVQKLAAIKAFTEKVLPGRWNEVRPPTRQELKGTAVLELKIDQASVKTRNRPPDDDDTPDAQLDTWAGVIPVITSYGTPIPSPGLRPEIGHTPSITNLLAGIGPGPGDEPALASRADRTPHPPKEGSIIAAIIASHETVNQPSAPRSVPGPASMPAIR
jgi:nitroimidazol reductase NimA-like FMN-containing flavoprotein (pyridoxamine 5'-phosphate oxidase superfamily)